MIGWLRNLFASPSDPRPTATITERENRILLARYDNAQNTEEQQRLWALSDPLSAKSANNFQVRRTLRLRSRYEYANNAYLQGTVNTRVNLLVGKGPKLKVKNLPDAQARQVEKAFARWAKAAGLVERLKTLAKAKIVDGEGFLVLTTREVPGTPVKLFLRDIEADQVTSPMAGFTQTQWVDGLVLDDLGEIVGYQILQSHPGDFFYQNLNPLAYKTIAKRFMIHWFRKDRPGQVRGIPETTSTLDLWGEMRRFRKATVTAAETAAAHAGVIKTKAPADASDDQMSQNGVASTGDTLKLEGRGNLLVLPWETEADQFQARHPTTTYDSFSEKLLGECSRGIDMPLNVALGSSQKFNFSSAKLDFLNCYYGVDIERAECEAEALDAISAAYFDEAVMIQGELPDGIDIENLECEWHWPPLPAIDPLTDAKADTERLQGNRTKTYRQHFAEQGKDWREEFEQFAAEAELAEQLGLPPIGPTKITVDEMEDDGPDGDEPPAPKTTPTKKAKDGKPTKEPAAAA